MRGFLECKGQSTRLEYDRERAGFVLKSGPHPFIARKTTSDGEFVHKNGSGKEPARSGKC